MTDTPRPTAESLCPVCGITPEQIADNESDPFAEELHRHGERARPFDNANRDRVRGLAQDCAVCWQLVEQWDATFAAHFLG